MDVRAWLIAVLAAVRITVMVIRGGRLGSRPWTAGENEREPCRNISWGRFVIYRCVAAQSGLIALIRNDYKLFTTRSPTSSVV